MVDQKKLTFEEKLELVKVFKNLHPSYAVIDRETVEEKTTGGIIIPEKVQDSINVRTSSGVILKISDLESEDTEVNARKSVYNVGDTVIFNPNHPYGFQYKDYPALYLINLCDLIAKIEEDK